MQTAAEADEVTGRIDHFTGHVEGDDDLWLGVRWVGCDAALDSRLPVTQLYEDVPDRVVAYLTDNAAEFPECAETLRKLQQPTPAGRLDVGTPW